MFNLLVHLKKKKKVKTNTKPKNWKQCKYISPSESPRVATFFFRFTWNHNANLDFSVERYWEVDGWEFPKLIITKWQRDNDAPLNSFVTVSLEFCSRWVASVYKLLNSDCGGIFFLKITGAHRPSFSCFEYVLYCFVNNFFLIVLHSWSLLFKSCNLNTWLSLNGPTDVRETHY